VTGHGESALGCEPPTIRKAFTGRGDTAPNKYEQGHQQGG